MAGLASPHPLGATLPSLYADDAFAQAFCAALDEVLAPVVSTLDCFPAYLDPQTTPPDVLDWLCGWVGLDAAKDLPLERRRLLVARAADLHAWRGTDAAIRDMVELATGRLPDLEESGGTYWSTRSGTAPPGSAEPLLTITVPSGPEPVDRDLLARLLTLVVPAHLPWRLDVG